MFSEVYWHHAVRSATAMLQRLVFESFPDAEPGQWLLQTDGEFQAQARHVARRDPGLSNLAEALFGDRRGLYKRMAQFSFARHPTIHQGLAGRPFEQLIGIGSELAAELARELAIPIADRDLLIDAPPEKLEVQFQVDVKSGETDLPPQPLAEISPVVKALATEQFDSYVKQVRVFVHPDVYGQLGKESMPAVSKLCERILRDICCG